MNQTDQTNQTNQPPAEPSIEVTLTVAQARTGDWAIVKNDDGTETLGVVVGHLVWARGEAGLAATTLATAKKAYRVE